MVVENKSLTELHLHDNRIGELGCKVLAQVRVSTIAAILLVATRVYSLVNCQWTFSYSLFKFVRASVPCIRLATAVQAMSLQALDSPMFPCFVAGSASIYRSVAID
jgi:hypothetical protein